MEGLRSELAASWGMTLDRIWSTSALEEALSLSRIKSIYRCLDTCPSSSQPTSRRTSALKWLDSSTVHLGALSRSPQAVQEQSSRAPHPCSLDGHVLACIGWTFRLLQMVSTTASTTEMITVDSQGLPTQPAESVWQEPESASDECKALGGFKSVPELRAEPEKHWSTVFSQPASSCV